MALLPGDCILLSGSIGAGKSHLARAAIRSLMQRAGEPPEDIPSPTYTLVQTYPCGDTEIWHADLYRLTDPTEVFELGLDTAFLDGICLIEWPDRLGSEIPRGALSITLTEIDDGAARHAQLEGAADRWESVLCQLELGAEQHCEEGCDDPF